MIYIVLLILTSFCNLAKNTDDIKQLAKLSPFIMIYIVLVITIQTPFYMKEKPREYTPFQFDLDGWIKSYGCYVYSFNCIVNVFMVKTQL